MQLMTQQGKIYGLQKVQSTHWGASKCVYSDLCYIERYEEAAPLSVKIVLEGKEEYRINGNGFKLKEQQYLVVNKGDSLETRVKHQASAKGICIYPPKSLVTEVASQSSLSLADQLEFCQNRTESIRFTSKVSRVSAKGLVADYLSVQVKALMSNEEKAADWWDDFYTELIDRLIKGQLELEDKLKQLPATKKHTREELYRRLSLAKDYIYDHRFETIDIDSLSKASALSKFHFIRNFKALYGCSPYQLSLHLKLKEAMTLIQKNHSYQQVSDMVGYSDSKNLRKALLKNS